ncbi:MAG: LytTR family DNA-binding domain-containing protein [Ferruginibacter sp.]
MFQNNNSKSINLKVKSLLQNINITNGGLHKIAVHTIEGLEFLNKEDIVRLEAKGSYTYFHLSNKSIIVASRNIKEYEEILSEEIFLRVHNSHVVNLNYIKKYHKGRGGYVILEDGKNIEVATRRKDDFLSRFD